jgi:hypothetical protein
MKPSLIVDSIPFFDAPSEIEGSPYLVDLWASVNGYRMGLQIKPKTHQASSLSIYTGKARSSQKKGHSLFKNKFGGKVFTASPNKGQFKEQIVDEILEEYGRLESLPKGSYTDLP